MSRSLVSDDGAVRLYEVFAADGSTVGWDEEPSEGATPPPTVDALLQALTDAVIAKTSVTDADIQKALDTPS